MTRRWTQDKFFNAGEEGNPHPWYGPCDGFGPDGTCCECQQAFGHEDGSVTAMHTKEVLRRAPLRTRLKRAWIALRQVPHAFQ